jgi:hypothetical protein
VKTACAAAHSFAAGTELATLMIDGSFHSSQAEPSRTGLKQGRAAHTDLRLESTGEWSDFHLDTVDL